MWDKTLLFLYLKVTSFTVITLIASTVQTNSEITKIVQDSISHFNNTHNWMKTHSIAQNIENNHNFKTKAKNSFQPIDGIVWSDSKTRLIMK